MNAILLFQVFSAISLAGIIFIFLRNLPLLCEFEPVPVLKEEKLTFRLKKTVKETKLKSRERFHLWSEKTAHKLRLIVLKIDNFLSSYLKKIRERKSKFFRKK